jgi:hypothetical protein
MLLQNILLKCYNCEVILGSIFLIMTPINIYIDLWIFCKFYIALLSFECSIAKYNWNYSFEQLLTQLSLHWFIIKVLLLWYNDLFDLWTVWDDSVKDLMVLSSHQSSSTLIAKMNVTILEVSSAIIFPPLTYYIIAHKEKFFYNIIDFFWNNKCAITYESFVIFPEYSKIRNSLYNH